MKRLQSTTWRLNATGRVAARSPFHRRSSEAVGPASQREEFRKGFLLYYDRLWELVNLRNDRQHYQDGLFMVEVPTFNEAAVREAITPVLRRFVDTLRASGA